MELIGDTGAGCRAEMCEYHDSRFPGDCSLYNGDAPIIDEKGRCGSLKEKVKQ